jgi:hypothetical protein
MKIAEYNEMMAYLMRPATGGRVGFYKGELVTEDGPNKGKYKVKFSYNQDYGDPKFKGVQYGTKKEIEDLISERKIISDQSYQAGVDKAAQIAKDKANVEIKNTIDSFIEKGDYENFKTKPYESQLKRKLPSGNIRQSVGGRVNPKTFQYIRDALDAGTDSDLFKNLMKITGKTEKELIEFNKKIPERGVTDIEKRATAAKESFPEERKLTEEQKKEAEKKVQAKRKDRLQKTTGKAKFIKGSDDFQFHHIKQIGGEAPLTADDVKVIDKVMNGELAPYNRKLNDIADAISQKITQSFEMMRSKNEGKALDLLKEVDNLNEQAESIVKSAHDKLPEKFKPLIGYNKVYARTDEYGFPLDDKVRIEPIGGGLKKGERSKPLTEYTRKDAANLQTEIDKQVKKLEKISQLKKDNPNLKSGEEIEQPKKSKIRNMFDSFNQKYMSSKPVIQKFSSKVPGSAAVLAPYDAAMMLLSGAPAYDALASGASYLTNDPLIGRAVNIPLALREMTNYGDEKEMFQRATERREGIESMLEGLPSRFKSYINENRGIDDETEEFVP